MELGSSRKVFFLHPLAVIQDDLVRGLVEENYEAYLLRNHVSGRDVLREYGNAVLFIQVDSGLQDKEWIAYADELKASPALAELTICAVSVRESSALTKAYLEKSKSFSRALSYAGFDYDRTMTEIRKILDGEKARPPGYAIRGIAPDAFCPSVDFIRDSNRYEGSLKQITFSGITCKIHREDLLPSDIPVPAIIITYGKKQFTISGRIVGRHGADPTLHLILFNEKSQIEKRDDIYDLIHACMQAEINVLIQEKSHKPKLARKTPRANLYRGDHRHGA